MVKIEPMGMDETQRIVEELERGGDVMETHADGMGVITIHLKRSGTGRPMVSGQGPSFPSALSGLLLAIEQQRLASET
jgi:hypothetical protein